MNAWIIFCVCQIDFFLCKEAHKKIAINWNMQCLAYLLLCKCSLIPSPNMKFCHFRGEWVDNNMSKAK